MHQRLSKLYGTFQLSGQADLTGRVNVSVDVWGDHVRFTNVPLGHQLRFDGHVHGNTMQGTLAMTYNGQLQEHAWKAQRDKADFTGTWEWPCATGARSVRLRIEQRDGHFIATYLDRDQEVRATDFYDCGGGFYFTLLIGRDESGLKITEDTGWLVGEAVADHRALKGTIEFYPWEGKTIERKDWTPRLTQP